MSAWTKQLLKAVKAQFLCDWHGYHGIHHWYRVMRLARDRASTDRRIDTRVTDLFALFHDAGRQDEYDDPKHGIRGAALAHKLRHDGLFHATDNQMAMLDFACCYHADGQTSNDPTIAACWDADRIELMRLGMCPADRYMSEDYLRWKPEAYIHKAYLMGLTERRLPLDKRKLNFKLP